ncbi:MAG: phosphatidate cytidylyltransferase [Anaerolineaceae bacterium]|nr:phosphatidate cytidylyltransferase [Anaerolineaceae bacterium]
MMSLLKRIIVSAIFIPIILFIMWKGGYYLLVFLSLVSLVGIIELRNLFLHKGVYLPWIFLPINVIFFIIASLYSWQKLFIMLFAVLGIIAVIDLAKNRLEGAIARFSTALFGMIYTALFLSSIYRIHVYSETGRNQIVLLILTIWATDSAAYFGGMYFGRHRNVFHVSPKKSLEGYISGFVFGLATTIVAHFWFPHVFPLHIAIYIGIAAGVFGQFGDLLESMLKRDAGVKDSSRLIPGHGGILDRFDSLLIAAPFLYFMLIYFSEIPPILRNLLIWCNIWR